MNSNQNTNTSQVVKYSTQLPPGLIKWVKREALDRDVRDYHLIRQALEEYKVRSEQQVPSQSRLDFA